MPKQSKLITKLLQMLHKVGTSWPHIRILRRAARRLRGTRWSDVERFDESWRTRIASMAALIDHDREHAVLDLGCGRMWLQEYLPPTSRYTGCDYTDRGGNLTCDFNRREFPEVTADVAFVSGCLEYMEDPEWFLCRVHAACPVLILSYCTLDRVNDRQHRRNLGWRNDLSLEGLLELTARCGFSLERSGPPVEVNELLRFRRK